MTVTDYVKPQGPRTILIRDDSRHGSARKVDGAGRGQRIGIVVSRIEAVTCIWDADCWLVQVDTTGGHYDFKYVNECDALAVWAAVLSAVDAR